MSRSKTIVTTAITTLLAIAILMIAFAWSGLYPVGAGSSHFAPIGWLLETTRERSVTLRASDLFVPEDIDSPERVSAGAGHYKDMCAGCHGAPGTEPARSFNPAPPALYRHHVEPREAFWTIKHGLRMTAMPSHLDHSDTDNWNTVAFVRALPDMSAEEYNQITEGATHDHADGQEHDHGAMTSSESETDSGEQSGHEHAEGISHKHSESVETEKGQSHDHGSEHHPEQTSDNDRSAADHDQAHAAPTPEEAINFFHHSLVEGRAEDALAYLHPQATVIEGGRTEAVSHYADGHMKSDMQFLGQISIEPISREVLVDSDTQATIVTKRRMHGQTEQGTLDIISVETATLIKEDADWRIVQLAWSSTPYGDT